MKYTLQSGNMCVRILINTTIYYRVTYNYNIKTFICIFPITKYILHIMFCIGKRTMPSIITIYTYFLFYLYIIRRVLFYAA